MESILEKEKHKILQDFVIQTDNQISVRKPDQVLINKKRRNYYLMDFVILADCKVK